MIVCEFKEETVKREARIYAYVDALMKMQQERVDLEKAGKPENPEKPIKSEKTAEAEEDSDE
ncbi:MAG: hypothetical protein LUF78_06815 [Clostridiales bacterium]|nr:hypothetical protein [Clostridiales bacterium]